MNLLLLSQLEAGFTQAQAPSPPPPVTLVGRRAKHLLSVLKVTPDLVLRAGVLDWGLADAQVIAVTAESVTVQLTNLVALRRPANKALLLAAPRPKVLSRCLQHAAALGFTQIELFRSYRVDKSHLLSHKARLEDQQHHLLCGLEQGRRVFMPRIGLHARFKPFVEDELPRLVANGSRFVAHPSAPLSTRELLSTQEPAPGYSLAIGPEGGFIPYEVEAFEAANFLPISAGQSPLRVESAISYLAGQLDLLTAPADPSPS